MINFKNAVVVGLQWGDEGKGKIVDLLSSCAKFVVRFQGGNNAGHTLNVSGDDVVLHLVPSGILRPKTTCVISNGVVVDPEVLVCEIEHLNELGVDVGPDRLKISLDCNIIMPYHRYLDELRENDFGSMKIGTTKKGIGPAYEDKVARRGIRFRDLSDQYDLRVRLSKILRSKDRETSMGVDVDPTMIWLNYFGDRLSSYICDTSDILWKAIDEDESILFEGAQGTFLDVDHGTYPYVTSSNTVAGEACAGSGIGPRDIDVVIGVMKAYVTRVGAGSFPTGQDVNADELLREKGREFGSTTGRPRRCGWLDVDQIRRAIRLNSVSHIALMKLDVLSSMETIHLWNGKKWEDHEGWREDISECRVWEDLPESCRDYVERIECAIDTKVSLISVGSKRDSNVIRDPLFDVPLSSIKN